MSVIKIHWCLRSKDAEGGSENNILPSLRLRLGAAKRSQNLNISTNQVIDKQSDIIIFSKNIYQNAGDEVSLNNNLRIADKLSKLNKPLLLDYTDHYLYNDNEIPFAEKLGKKVLTQYLTTAKYYKEMIARVDGVIVSSKALERSVRQHTQKSVYFIPDAIDPTPFMPEAPSLEKPIGLWYGMHSTFMFLLMSLPKISDSLSQPIKIHCLVQKPTMDYLRDGSIKAPKVKNVSLDAQIWSTDRVIKQAGRSNFILVPSDKNDFRKSYASSNRLLTAFSLQRPVFATPIDSYLDFKDHFYDLDRQTFDLLNEVKYHTKEKITSAKNLTSDYQFDVIANKWSDVFNSFLNQHSNR